MGGTVVPHIFVRLGRGRGTNASSLRPGGGPNIMHPTRGTTEVVPAITHLDCQNQPETTGPARRTGGLKDEFRASELMSVRFHAALSVPRKLWIPTSRRFVVPWQFEPSAALTSVSAVCVRPEPVGS